MSDNRGARRKQTSFLFKFYLVLFVSKTMDFDDVEDMLEAPFRKSEGVEVREGAWGHNSGEVQQ